MTRAVSAPPSLGWAATTADEVLVRGCSEEEGRGEGERECGGELLGFAVEQGWDADAVRVTEAEGGRVH